MNKPSWDNRRACDPLARTRIFRFPAKNDVVGKPRSAQNRPADHPSAPCSSISLADFDHAASDLFMTHIFTMSWAQTRCGSHVALAIPIDNNACEREMKRIVLNRKNSLFVGHERAGHTAAIISSLASTCRLHAIASQRYLTQLLNNLPAAPVSRLDRWLPDEWKRRDCPPPTA